MDTSGRIHETTPERLAELERAAKKRESDYFDKRPDGPGPRPRRIVKLSYDQAAFFKTKGVAFRSLWAKRLARGLTQDEAAQLDQFLSKGMDALRIKIVHDIQQDLYGLSIPGRAIIPLTPGQLTEIEAELGRIAEELSQ